MPTEDVPPQLVPIGHDGREIRLVLHVVDAGADIDDGLEHWVAGHVGDVARH